MRNEVVITGLGATTPLGGNVASTWEAVLAGRSGVSRLPFDWPADLPVKIGAVAAVDPATLLTAAELNHHDRSAQFALIAAREAWQDAGLLIGSFCARPQAANNPSFCARPQAADAESCDPTRLAVSISSSLGGIQTTLAAADTLRERGPRRLSPLTIPMLMPNSAAAAVELDLGAEAGAYAPTSACASGAEAIAYGFDLIRAGRADVVVAGGTEAPLHPMVVAAFAAARTLSARNDAPTVASRPFDLNRDGFVMGEGAAVLILESETHALARGAQVYARLAGTGITSDAYHVTAPSPDGRGQIKAMRLALSSASAQPDDIVHLNPHATATKLGDAIEAAAIRSVLGEAANSVIVSATKSMTAHLLGAAGALEAILAVLALRHRTAPPTINLVDFDPAITIPINGPEPAPLPAGPTYALSNSFGFGGHNVSLVFGST